MAGSNPELRTNFNGLTSRDQRLANGGNQFSVEPPDQALCVANGRALESVNTVIRVRDLAGGNVTGVVDLNTFYGYPAQIQRPAGPFGPFITDPVCLYVPELNRFVQVVLTLDQDPATGNFLGSNHLDVAVSNTGNPAGTWTVYPIAAQNDGTQGTPDHRCPTPPPEDVPPGATNPRAEIGDYPHLGMDENGIYLTTNGYCFFSAQYNGAQLYAIGFDQAQRAAQRGGDRPAGVPGAGGQQPDDAGAGHPPRQQGVLAFTVMGEDHFPSAGYAAIDGTKKSENDVIGRIHVSAAGRGPDDGFTSYKALVGDPPRTRWGDYGAAWINGSDVWIASEWIGQRCTLTGPGQYYPSPPDLTDFGSCGGTRVALTNWFTRISKVTP